MKHNLADIVRHFDIAGRYLDAEPYGSGHINDTYRTRWESNGKSFWLIQQRINHNVFKDPVKVMDNILRVTQHLRRRLSAVPGSDPDRETLTVIPARDGKPFYLDPEGNHWRTYVFIDRATSYDVCDGAAQATAAARAFGRFQQLLVDLPGGRLHDTIPYFHHTPRRFATLEAAIANAAEDRKAAARADIEFARAHKDMTGVVTGLLESGKMPERITHNDTKLNNVMLDDATREGVCVIDLDTVMCGSVLYDFGDMVRTCTRTSVEDERNLGAVNFRMDIFEALVRGYMQTAGSFLAPSEVEHLAFAGSLITFTIGIRFLADYLAGDVYFKTHRPGQNLDRARVQFHMVRHMEDRAADMKEIVRRCAG